MSAMSTQTNNAGSGSITVCHSSRSRLLTSNSIPCEAASSILKSEHLLRDSGNAGSFLRDRPRDTHPPHLGQQRGSLQAKLRRRATRSADYPAGLLKCFQNQSAIRIFQGHRRLEGSDTMQTGDHQLCLLFVKWVWKHAVPRKDNGAFH